MRDVILNQLRLRWPRSHGMQAGALLALTALLAGPACAPSEARRPSADSARFVSQGYSDRGLLRISARMDPAMRSLVLRHDPGRRRVDLWARSPGWGSLDMNNVPTLGFEDQADALLAAELNDLRPFSQLPIRPMTPFRLQARTEDRARALQCLSQAVYYEAAREPQAGQEAVAQVVLNRMRHPAYPKSVCGVVYQGSARTSGCQFTFTCDGALRWAPEPDLWRGAKAVAERALAGYVNTQVGSATHYHAQYVVPYWAPTLVKMVRVGQHIFYRWTGPWGEPPAFDGRYAGNEAYLTPEILGGVDQRTQGGLFSLERQGIPTERTVTLDVAGEVRTYSVVDPTQPGGERIRVKGVLMSQRRQATPEEIKRINESLEALERDMGTRPVVTAPSIAAPIPATPGA